MGDLKKPEETPTDRLRAAQDLIDATWELLKASET